ncbi:MAG: M1 family peptidase [Bacteroidetes bacterium]|jgi:hypothetical protein|nr:M1 family peptidase [Bacteroidota bacterium]
MRTLSVALSLVALLLAGCAALNPLASSDDASPRATTTASTTTPPATPRTVLPKRPIPQEISVPPAFENALRRGTRTPDGHPGPDYWQQGASYTLEARVYPDEKRLEGDGQITYQNNAPRSLSVLRLELLQNVHAEGALRLRPAEVTGGIDLRYVVADGDTLTPEGVPGYAVEGTQLVIRTPEPLASGASATLDIGWSFQIPQQGAGGRMGYSEDDLLYLAYWYPQMAVYDDVYGWHTDPFTGNAEFYAGFADYDLTIEAPEQWLVLSTGALQNPDSVLAPPIADRMREAYASDETVQVVGPDDFGAVTRTNDEGRLRWHFTAERVRDVAFSVTRASLWDAARTAVGDRDGDGQTDYAYINTLYRESAPRWAEVTRYQQHALTFQSDYTGIPYPWPHMTAVEGGGIIGGGMEFPMMTIMGDYNARGDSALYYVTAHELAHMWVPMIVNTNERRYSWMDEGMTTFLENESRYDFFPGPDHKINDQRNYIFTALAGIEGEMMRRSDFHYSGQAFGIASYSKPATILVALRGVLGPDTFMRAYRTFLNEWAYKHPYPWDFFNTVERVSGRDLDWFWRSWYYETWTMDQAVADVQPTPDGTQITIADRGTVPMPVHLAVTLDTGETMRIQIPVDTWLSGATRATVDIDADAAVTEVLLDPDRHFPDVDRANNTWEHTSP